MSELADRILALVAKKNYQPLKPKALARKLAVPLAEYKHFREVLQGLADDGRLEIGKSLSVQPAAPAGTAVGLFKKAQAGFGFVRVRPADGSAPFEVYVPEDGVGDASSGDEVLVKLTKKPSRVDHSAQGEILRVVERATQKFVGTYFVEGGEGLVRVDGTVFSAPIYVGDPGAKGARPDDKVVLEMLRFPSPALRGEAVITEVLGPRGQPGVDALSVIRAFELPDAFPEDVLREARRQAAAFDEADLAGREDFTKDLVITIDPVGARDHDDAVTLTYDSHKRHWHLAVHIADVGHFAPAGSLLDREARQRGTSVYLPRQVIPMFPEIISNDLASLQEGKVRYTQTALMEFTQQGQRVAARFANGAIKVRRRLTYEQVSALFRVMDRADGAPAADGGADAGVPPDLGPDVIDMLVRMRDFALVLRGRRLKRGALELTMPEAELEYDDQGKVTGAHFRSHDVSHQLIEEFMLAANEAVAEHLAEHGVLFLRRVHLPPTPQKLEDFCAFANLLGYDLDPRRATDRFQLQAVLEKSAARPEARAVHFALLRSLKQAEYSPADEGHYALASRCYCHFTSPIRRYPDLTVHRLLGQLFRTGRAGSDYTELVALGEHCSATERRAEQAERELIKVKVLEYMSTRVGLELDVVITGVEEFGFFCQAETMPVDGLVRISSLTDDFYVYEALSHSLTGRRTRRRFRLGDKARVRVARVDVERRHLDFQLATKAEPGEAPEREPGRKGKKAKGRKKETHGD
jgi:ribonuclease R